MDQLDKREKENRRKGVMWSFGLHSLILLIAILPWFKFQDPPPEKQGILVSFGAPNMGQGDSRPRTQNQVKVTPEPPSEEAKEAEPAEASEPKPEVTPIPEEVVTAPDPDAVALRKQQERERAQEQERREAEARRRAEADEAKREAEAEEARKKAEYEKSKEQFGDLFGGKGKGKTDKKGNQGDPNGDPDASNLEGISSGSGRVGGGLGSRGLVYEPTVVDKSQKTGKVVMKVCVGSQGAVVSADFTQRGSTTTDATLIKTARDACYRYKFNGSDITKQCGTITFDFKLK